MYTNSDSDYYNANPHMSESNKSNLNIAIINCQSIIAKKASFHNFLAEHNPDIVAGCESWLTPIKSAEVFPGNLKIYRRDRSDGYGGVFIACRETLITEEVVHEVNVEVVICHIKLLQHKSLIVCSVYRPPNNDISYMQHLCHLLESIVSKYRNCPIWRHKSPKCQLGIELDYQ